MREKISKSISLFFIVYCCRVTRSEREILWHNEQKKVISDRNTGRVRARKKKEM